MMVYNLLMNAHMRSLILQSVRGGTRVIVLCEPALGGDSLLRGNMWRDDLTFWKLCHLEFISFLAKTMADGEASISCYGFGQRSRAFLTRSRL